LPVLDRVQDVITGKIIPAISLFITQMQNGTGAGGQFVAILMSFAGALGAPSLGSSPLTVTRSGSSPGSVIGIAAAVKVWTIAQVALNFALTANPIGIVVVALAGLAAGLVYAYKRSETFRNIVNGTFTVVKAVVGSVAGWLSKYVPRAFAILVSGVRTYINIYRTVVVTAFKVVRAIIGAVGSFVAGSVKFYIAYLNGVRSVLGKVVSFVKSIPGKVKSPRSATSDRPCSTPAALCWKASREASPPRSARSTAPPRAR
jgi:phage-related protein